MNDQELPPLHLDHGNRQSTVPKPGTDLDILRGVGGNTSPLSLAEDAHDNERRNCQHDEIGNNSGSKVQHSQFIWLSSERSLRLEGRVVDLGDSHPKVLTNRHQGAACDRLVFQMHLDWRIQQGFKLHGIANLHGE